MVVRELESMNERTVALTQVGDVVVSTVSLSLPMVRSMDSLITTLGAIYGGAEDRADLSTPGDYETMVFDCDDNGEVTNYTEKDFARYATKEEAEEGHKQIVEKWKEKGE